MFEDALFRLHSNLVTYSTGGILDQIELLFGLTASHNYEEIRDFFLSDKVKVIDADSPTGYSYMNLWEMSTNLLSGIRYILSIRDPADFAHPSFFFVGANVDLFVRLMDSASTCHWVLYYT